MGCWDELCLLCGVSGCGPSFIASTYGDEPERAAKAMASDINPADDEIVEIVKSALQAADTGDSVVGPRFWMPKGLASNGYADDYMAIGSFDDNNLGFAVLRGGKAPRGEEIEVRRVDGITSGSFTEIVIERDGKTIKEPRDTNCTAGSEDGRPNIWLDTRCYRYLESWLDWDSIPPPSAEHFSGRPSLSFASELYEIVYSRKSHRDDCSGLPPEIDYQGIEASLEQWQDYFYPCRRGSKHLAEAVKAGLRGADLIPAILQDCRAWMFMRPDMWPIPPNNEPLFSSDRIPFSVAADIPQPRLASLPNELLLPILRELPLNSLLALSATCRSLYMMITERTFFDRVIAEAIAYGSLRWMLPVETMVDEKRAAFNVLRLWLPDARRPEAVPEPRMDEDCHEDHYWASDDEDTESDRDDTSQQRQHHDVPLPEEIPPVLPILMSDDFDRIAFVRACWESDSMTNRRRLWGQAKQFEALWTDYRRHGWQVDRFYSVNDSTLDI